MRHTRPFFLIRTLLAALMPLAVASCGGSHSALDRPLKRFDYERTAFGAPVRVLVYAENEPVAKSVFDAAMQRIAALENELSPDNPNSDVAKLHAGAGGPAQKIGPDLLLLLRKGQEIAKRSDGAFDITDGALKELWRKARATGTTPSDAQIEEAMKQVGWRNLEIDADKQTARLTVAGMRLDLGEIARGYAADQALQTLRQRGNGRALVQIGQAIAVGDPPRMSQGWQVSRVDLEEAKPGKSSAGRAVYDAGVASAGRQPGGTLPGKTVPPLDPRTGRPAAESTPVTIVAPNALTAGPLSSAATLLGPVRARELLRNYPGTTAYFPKADDAIQPTSRPR